MSHKRRKEYVILYGVNLMHPSQSN